MGLSRVTVQAILIILFQLSVFAQSKPPQFRRAQVIRPEVEIYQSPSFDSDIIVTINPGKFYFISNKLYGPFYRIKLSSKVIGYVADTELDIEGQGRIKEKPFIDDSPQSKDFEAKPFDSDDESDDSNDPYGKQSYNQIVVHLVNYHENTMDQNLVADQWALGYRHIPFLSDFSASVSWDINLSWGVPRYYKDKLGVEGTGGTGWAGAQLVNITPLGASKTLRYGLGPFLKYSNYSIKTVNKNYSLQDLNMGFLFEGGFIYHIGPSGIDIGLRYYWEKTTYGGLSVGILF
jgi:hypothetical protein